MKESFAIKKDGNGIEYIEKFVDELSKNHRENNSCEGGVIYATGTDNCPIVLFKLYMKIIQNWIVYFNDQNNLRLVRWYDANYSSWRKIYWKTDEKY